MGDEKALTELVEEIVDRGATTTEEIHRAIAELPLTIFDRIGIRDAILETDPYGNFLTQGYEFLPARDWARLANLYLQDGMWDGERILPEGWVDYASGLAPAWESAVISRYRSRSARGFGMDVGLRRVRMFGD